MKLWGALGVLLLFFTATETTAAPLYIKETIEPTEVERDSGILVPMRDLRMQDGLIEPKEPEPEPEPEPSVYYYGACRITFYCRCSTCCGKDDGITASGASATSGWTVANGSLQFGTKVIIDGHTYCVEDRGVSANQFDIFVDSHDEALARGLYYSDVYIVEG